MKPVNYASGKTPKNYKCAGCKAKGIRLWREYQTFTINLKCVDCSEKEQKKKFDAAQSDQIGWRIAAVPDEEGDGYWGYTSVPEAGVKWWWALPLRN
jgi:hypothetical protein